MTFSIVARDMATGSLGMAVTTGVACVGAMATHVSLGAAVATQAYVSVDLGLRVLQAVDAGSAVDVAAAAALDADPSRDMRQVIGIDATGRTFAHTGDQPLPWRGHLVRDGFVVAGNALVGAPVLEAMASAYVDASGLEFTRRLVKALEAGQAAGGERELDEIELHIQNSAAVLVASPEPRLFHNLRVDAADDAVAELVRVYGAAVASAQAMESFYTDQAAERIRPLFWRLVD